MDGERGNKRQGNVVSIEQELRYENCKQCENFSCCSDPVHEKNDKTNEYTRG